MYDVKKLASKLSIKQSMLAHIIEIGTSTLSAYANGKASKGTVEKVDAAIEKRFDFKGYLEDVSMAEVTVQAEEPIESGIEIATGIPIEERKSNVVGMQNGAFVHFIQPNGMLSRKSYRYSLRDVDAKVGDKVLVQVKDGESMQVALVVALCRISNPSDKAFITAVLEQDVAAA